jgi:hypothetical protein
LYAYEQIWHMKNSVIWDKIPCFSVNRHFVGTCLLYLWCWRLIQSKKPTWNRQQTELWLLPVPASWWGLEMLNCSDNLPQSRKVAMTIRDATDFDKVKAFIIALIQQRRCRSLIKLANYGLVKGFLFRQRQNFHTLTYRERAGTWNWSLIHI